MKLKKGILSVLLIALILIIAGIFSEVKAETAGPMYLGAVPHRSSGYRYKRNDLTVWKIATFASSAKGTNLYNQNETNVAGYSIAKTLYCIKAGPGFGSDNMSNPDNASVNRARISVTEYSQRFDLINDYSTMDSKFKSVLPTGSNYNALVWILQHCYVKEMEDSAAYRTQLLSTAKNYIDNASAYELDVDLNPFYTDLLTDDDIDVVQQAAIWYFTNTDNTDFHDRDIGLALKLRNDADYTALSAIYGESGDNKLRSQSRQQAVKYLYWYFIDNAQNAAAPNPQTNSISVSIDKSNENITLEGSNYIVGPYSITVNGSTDYTLESSLKDGNNNVSYTILNSSKVATTDLKGTLNSFYLQIPASSYKAGLSFSVNATSNIGKTKIYYWNVDTDANSLRYQQPIVEIIKEPDSASASITTPNIVVEKEFDLALRKFITKITKTDGTVVTPNPTRVPQITDAEKAKIAGKTATYDNGTTLEKTHPKDALLVSTGDTVLYTIRVYNEGEIDGKATKVTDYLPAGLEFIPASQSTINYNNGWTNPSGDGKTIVTEKLKDTKIDAVNGSQIDFEDLQIECKVVADPSTSVSLKNIAEITEAKDSNGNSITDIDSTPKDLTDTQKSNYNPSTSEKGKGYEDDDDFEELKLVGKPFDLALRKFIVQVNDKELKDSAGKYIKEPVVDFSQLNVSSTTAKYAHPKNPVGVAVGDEVIYTIRVYNEGEIDGYVTEITDHLPSQLEFIVNDELNAQYGWKISSDGRTVTTDITSPNTENSANRDTIYAERENGVLLKAFNGQKLDSIDVKIKCKVKQDADISLVITNIAEISKFTDGNGNVIEDRDSHKSSNLENKSLESKLPKTEQEWSDYKGTSNNSILNTPGYYYEGQEDDDDFDKLELKEFDLALRKFITAIEGVAPAKSREPQVDVSKLASGEAKTATYTHPKDPLYVQSLDEVEYTIRIYNEGNISGYANLVKDDIPEGLEFLPNHPTNSIWKMLDKDGNETTNVKEAVSIVTDALSKEKETENNVTLLKAFDPNTMSELDKQDVKVVFKVVAPNTYTDIITNKAQIADDKDENGNDVNDRDSTPDKWIEGEDDQDVEHIKLKYFDLALRKFITGVNETEVKDRYPVFKITEDGKYVYEHTKEPVDVMNNDVVIYTIRVYNEGTMAGYAETVEDDVPDGLEFLPNHEINTKYGWIEIDENGKESETSDQTKAIYTDYLAKFREDEGRNNLLKAFNPETMDEPDYRELQIAFRVTEPNTSDRILINHAQITDDADENGDDVIDIDSTPKKWIEGEDDQDIEKVKVKYFDLALRKWVTQAIVIENGTEKVTETGHKAEDDPEEVVKVEIEKSKINKVVVKFRYSIRITNEGEIAGYAKEISDYIPEGLKFVAADNPEWREVDGKVVTNKLADTLLQPGETAEVEILLTWINGADNMGLKVNVAEISEDYNDSHTPDIDSTPNNKKPGEDDIDDAPVILATKTGIADSTPYIVLTIGSLSVISTAAILIKKYILK